MCSKRKWLSYTVVIFDNISVITVFLSNNCRIGEHKRLLSNTLQKKKQEKEREEVRRLKRGEKKCLYMQDRNRSVSSYHFHTAPRDLSP